ncbi:3-phenylpropionate/trans-cinnamate dioxygenase ferredoxin subunit [Paenibacillus sp. UNC496MF]|uniref:Rieske (2Fe-2S) protein n=1 Tax=Paenibacillus sp. UNC496MF TaxID=1502753 RepID=UPI0008E608CD|nr:Rieske (2Fe-2S) protein [Paenibacillus sp. UNC496MF]SFJ37049.1 3-phenylpropionate/trans-cinnamate dioxygenase ferredoxin subunit [Paenibacillus sp. UNC496MF]
MGSHVVGTVAEFPAGTRRTLVVEGRPIGVFNVHGRFYALKNSCPHQGAPLCVGTVTGMTLPSAPGEYAYGRDGEIVRCPWHGWEFDITTGKSIFDPHKCLVKTYEVTIEAEASPEVETYPVTVESGTIVVHL